MPCFVSLLGGQFFAVALVILFFTLYSAAGLLLATSGTTGGSWGKSLPG